MSALTNRLAAAVQAHPHVRVPFEVLAAAAIAADQSLLAAPDRRERLAGVVEDLVARHVIRLPAGTTGWDRSLSPPLPRWVIRRTEPRHRPLKPPARAWVPELAFASTTRLTPPERSILERLNDFLRDGGSAAEPIPLRERAYELFRDEKRLDHLPESRLVVDGLVSLERHVRAYVTPPPLHTLELGRASWILIAENAATFASLRVVLRQRAIHDPATVGWLGYGAGNLVIHTIPYLMERIEETGHELAALYYFGDLDIDGLEIARRASAQAIRTGLPPLVPAVGLYQALAERPVRESDRVDAERARIAASWLPEPLAGAVADHLANGRCIRQEALPLPMIRRVAPMF